MSDFDLVVWGLYFLVGISLLILLLIGRKNLQTRKAKRIAAAEAIARVKEAGKPSIWLHRYTEQRGYR